MEIYRQFLVENPEDLISFLRKAGGQYHLFRGQSASFEELTPKIVRRTKPELRNMLAQFERDIVHHYQQQAQNHLATAPELDDYFEWLALIQHYGGPTRLLDFSRSLFVAAYFAVSGDDASDGLIFAYSPINQMLVSTFEHRNREKLAGISGPVDIPPSHHVEARQRGQQMVMYDIPQVFKRSVGREILNKAVFRAFYEGELKIPALVFASPFRRNKRMVAQNAVFALPFSLEHCFEDNLSGMYDGVAFKKSAMPLQPLSALDVSKEVLPAIILRIPARLRDELKGLLWQMGITTEALFPDIEGLSRAMSERMPRFLFD